MGNGTPIGCTVATPEIADAVKGATLSTFGGNPVTMATALATIEYIEKHNLKENAAVQGGRLRAKLEEFKQEFPFIGDVRGMGLMQALEIVKPHTTEADAGRTTALLNAARDQGLLLGKGGLYGNTIRIAPHLNVSADDIDACTDMLAKALVAVS
jgi:4-aminobutyrate aminotransferase-like enzyme